MGVVGPSGLSFSPPHGGEGPYPQVLGWIVDEDPVYLKGGLTMRRVHLYVDFYGWGVTDFVGYLEEGTP